METATPSSSQLPNRHHGNDADADPSSFCHPDEARVIHVTVTWSVDFARRAVAGRVKLTMRSLDRDVTSVVLDTNELRIIRIRFNEEQEADFAFGESEGKELGTPLIVILPQPIGRHEDFSLTIDYETSPTSKALQWMEAEQTLEKTHPYVYSQCQSVFARSLFPCQDTPGVKFTFDAEVTVKQPLTALMSGVQTKPPTSNQEDGTTTFYYRQDIPIASYLIAIVVGRVSCRQIGPRSRVWCEEKLLDAAAWEFAETEKMVRMAEDLCGEFVWPCFDIVVMPPTFPYQGMENPCLTFVSPYIVVGNRTLTQVVTHEIIHSWTGNLVTNKNWQEFWLNEGFTRFYERKILAATKGKLESDFEALRGLENLKTAIRNRKQKPHLTRLIPDLRSENPEEAFSVVPYEKGSAFLLHIEQLVGGASVFEPFMRSYIDHFKYKSVTTQQWKVFLYEYFAGKKELLDAVDWNAWLYSPGMPHKIPDYNRTLLEACLDLAGRWKKTKNGIEFSRSDIAGMSDGQISEFLRKILQQRRLSSKLYARMEACYDFAKSSNPDHLFKWIQIGLRVRDERKIEVAIEFVKTHRRGILLGDWELSRDRAIELFKEESKCLHPTSVDYLTRSLKI